jgi:methylated-DNA-[protein]-cysteine S-methyltransferase
LPAHRRVDSPIGPLLLAASSRGLTQVVFAGLSADQTRRGDADPAAESVLDRAATQLDEYFAGARREFDLPLDLTGSDFNLRAWRQIAAITFGETVSYSEVAARAGAPRAFRAAGAACGANRVAVVIPCHRVVAADASLHGYGGGLEMKRWLLEHEGVPVEGGRVRRPAPQFV